MVRRSPWWPSPFEILGPSSLDRRSDGGAESRKSYGRGVPNTSERMHSFWLSQLEEATEGLRTDADEWSASLVQRARGYARLGPVPHFGVEYERLEALRSAMRAQQGLQTGRVAEALSKALLLLGEGGRA